MDTPAPAKLYAYVDESGQDTRGALFVVSVVVTGGEREALRRRLHRIERLSGKRERKWTNARPAQRAAYIRQVLQVRELYGALYYTHYENTRSYVDCSILSTARAVLAHVPSHQATVLVDGLSRAERRRFAAGLRHHRVSVSKVRGVQEQSDALSRLADALAGFVRAGIQGDSVMQALLRQARDAGNIREA